MEHNNNYQHSATDGIVSSGTASTIDTGETTHISFDSPIGQSSYIKVIGVGGGGNNAVNHMYRKGISGVDFIVCNTDMKALNSSPVPNKLVLGNEGLGVGGNPPLARKAAEEKEVEIKQLFEHNTKMVFITAGMGGGTGTGAAPVIARMAKEIKLEAQYEDDPGHILVVAVVTTPFRFEGNRRVRQALEGVEELRQYVDSILVINNEKLRSYGNLIMHDAFSLANDVLLTAVKGIAEIITLNAYVNIDFRDVYSVMAGSGTALMGIGEGEGENRACQAIEEATTSALLDDNDIEGAKDVLLYFSYATDHELTMDEMGEVTDYLTQKTGNIGTNVIWGMGTDDSLGEKIRITLIATGFNKKEQQDLPAAEPDRLKQDPKIAPKPTPVEVKDTTVVVEPKPTTIDTPKPATQDVVTSGTRNVIPLEGDRPIEQKPRQEDNSIDDGPRLVSHGAKNDMPIPPSSSREFNTMYSTIDQHSETATAEVNEYGRGVAEFKDRHQPLTPASGVSFGIPRRVAPNPSDLAAMDRLERIKAYNELLRKHPNGPQIIESIRPEELTGERISEIMHSTRSDVAQNVLDVDGNVKPNQALYSNPD